MPRQRQTAVCREGWYYLLVLGMVFVAAMARDVNLLLLLSGMLAGPLIFSWPAVVLTLRGLQVQRKVPQTVCAGDLLVAGVSLTNIRRRSGSWAVVVDERLQRETENGREEPIRPAVLFPYVPAGKSRKGVPRSAHAARTLQVGTAANLNPVSLRIAPPHGHRRADRRADRLSASGAADTPLGRAPRVAQRRASSGAAVRPRRRLLRRAAMCPGDSRRWIHWRSSARRDELVVCQFEQPRNRDLAVLVDLWQPEQPQPHHLENVELAVSFAASAATDLCRKGSSNLVLGTTGAAPQCTGGPASAVLLQDVMERLAVVEAHSEDHLPELFELALGQIEPGTEIVLVSTRSDSPARVEALSGDTARRVAARRLRVVDVSGDQLDQYFRTD